VSGRSDSVRFGPAVRPERSHGRGEQDPVQHGYGAVLEKRRKSRFPNGQRSNARQHRGGGPGAAGGEPKHVAERHPSGRGGHEQVERQPEDSLLNENLEARIQGPANELPPIRQPCFGEVSHGEAARPSAQDRMGGGQFDCVRPDFQPAAATAPLLLCRVHGGGRGNRSRGQAVHAERPRPRAQGQYRHQHKNRAGAPVYAEAQQTQQETCQGEIGPPREGQEQRRSREAG
jgi:hypothetical protein